MDGARGYLRPRSNAWHDGPALPEPRSDAAAVALDSVLYAFGGGFAGQTRRDALMLRDGHWTQAPAAELPAPRHYAAAATSGNIIYLSCGLENGGDLHSATNTLWAWNPAAPRSGWKQLPEMPGERRMTQGFAALDGKLYVFGGAMLEADGVKNLRDAYRFDIRTGVWTKLKDLPVARRAWSAVATRNKILLLGGYTDTFEKEIFEYDPSTETVRSAGLLPHGVAGAAFISVQGRLIGTGGEVGNHIRGQWTMEMRLGPTD